MGKKITPNPKPKPIRLYVREWRKVRGLTQEQLAERIGMTAASVSRLEKGLQNWDQEFLQAAATALRCDPRDLVMRDPTPSPDGRPNIYSIWDNVPPVKQPQALAVLQTFADAEDKTGTRD